MNNMDRCRLTTQRVTLLNRNLEYLVPACVNQDFYDRKPRKKYKLDKKTIEIELPPSPLPKTKIPLLLRMGSSAVMGGQALLSGNILGAVTSTVFPSLTQGITEKDRKEYEAKRVERYREYLNY